jgi:hypothetical protein
MALAFSMRQQHGCRSWRRLGQWLVVACAAAAVLCLPGSAVSAPPPPNPDVVVIVDTSTSMTEPGMDPQRTSLLATQLFADILPGDLAAVRLLDIADDAALLPRRETGRTEPCQEDPNKACNMVEPDGDWEALALTERLGVLARAAPGDAAFKAALPSHLAQVSGNSMFHLAFRAAEGVFEQRPGDARKRIVVWLSDGRTDDEPSLARAVRDLRADGVEVAALVFGRGDTALAARAGLAPLQVTTPAELMAAFADIARQALGAPYRLDGLVETRPELTVEPNVETLWVVVYGDESLHAVTLTDPQGRTHAAELAAGSWPGAGAYRVMRVAAPLAGRWRLATDGGGPERAYAVIQRSTLGPRLLAPATAQADVETRLVAAVTAAGDDTPITDPDVLAGARLVASIDGREVTLADTGSGADEAAGDGRFSGLYRFTTVGEQPVRLSLQSRFANTVAEAMVSVTGLFRYGGDAPVVDLGRLAAPAEVCRPVPLDAARLEHRGTIPFELTRRGHVPGDHRLSLRVGGEEVGFGGSVTWPAGSGPEVCLAVGPRAPSSQADGRPEIVLTGADGGTLAIGLRWDVQGLGFWGRWGWLVLTLVGLAVLLAVVLGFVLPRRFSPRLALSFAPGQDELDDYPPRPLRRAPGTRSGFYRDARAYLHPDFRISARAGGALAVLHALPQGARVQGVRGGMLYRDDGLGDWQELAADGERARLGEVYRVGDAGPFFRLAVR